MVLCTVETVHPLICMLLHFLQCIWRCDIKLYHHWPTLWDPYTT